MKKALALILAIVNIVLISIILKAPKKPDGGVIVDPPVITEREDGGSTETDRDVVPNSNEIESWLKGDDQGKTETGNTETEQGSTTETGQGTTTETGEWRPEDYAPSRDWSDVDSPTEYDFAWVEDMMWQGVPSKANYITDVGEISGRWKSLYMFPDGNEGYDIMKMGNVDISIEQDGVKVAETPYLIDVGEGWFQDTDGVFIYSGSMDEYGVLYTSSRSGNFEINFFCEYDGYQFALGVLTVPSGEQAYIALQRP